jgi:hypothetical protein
MPRTKYQQGMLLAACGLLWLVGMAGCSRQPTGVEVLLTDDQPGTLTFQALLSPGRDQFVYTHNAGLHDSPTDVFLVSLATGETRQIPLECRDYLWLDNETLFCWPAIAVLDVSSFESRPAQERDAQQQDATMFVQPEHTIYEWRRINVWQYNLVLRSPDPANTIYLSNVAKDDPIWQRADLIPFSSGILNPVYDTPVASPDGQYYYIFHFSDGDDNGLRIHNAADDRLLREVRFKSNKEAGATVTGWTADSSGVIYRVSNSFLSLPRPAPILKLTVP